MLKATRNTLKSTLAVALTLPLAGASQADVVVELNKNNFVGTVGFGLNSAGSAVDIMLNTFFGMKSANLNANSVNGLFDARNSTPGFPQVSPRAGRLYTLSAEADNSAGFVVYNIFASANFGTYTAGQFFNSFSFNNPSPPNPLTLTKGAPPTVANFQECVGIVEVNFTNNCSAPTTPILLGDPYIYSTRSATFAPGPTGVLRHIAKPASSPQTFTLHYSVGNDPYSNQIQNEITFSATTSCDIVTPVCLDSSVLPGTCVGANCPPSILGNIIGLQDIESTLENANNRRTEVGARSGIYGNFRKNDLRGEPGTITPPPVNPVGPPRDFNLLNLVPSTYQVYFETTTGTNGAYNFIGTNSVPTVVVASQTTNLGAAFVTKKAEWKGKILLTQFPTAAQPNAPPSGLNDLYYSYITQSPANGLPTSYDLSTGSRLYFSGNGAFSVTAWPYNTNMAGFSDSLFGQTSVGMLRSNYLANVVRANNAVAVWPDNGQTHLELRFDQDGTVDGFNPPRANGNLIINETIAQLPLEHKTMTASRTYDFEYCFGTVRVIYKTKTGSLYAPVAQVRGSYQGTLNPKDPNNNFMEVFSRVANYSTRATFIGLPQSSNPNAPVNIGDLLMTLPAGNYTLFPSVTVDDGSSTSFPSATFSLACDEYKVITPPALVLCDVDLDGDIDKNDLSLISRARGQRPVLGDPRDANLDGVIDAADVKACIAKCTRANCTT